MKQWVSTPQDGSTYASKFRSHLEREHAWILPRLSAKEEEAVWCADPHRYIAPSERGNAEKSADALLVVYPSPFPLLVGEDASLAIEPNGSGLTPCWCPRRSPSARLW
jgi:hypothetical protein